MTLLLDRFGAPASAPARALVARRRHVLLLSLAFAYYSVRLAWQSHAFNDISQGNDATPLWIPQIAMAVGSVLLAIAMVDDLRRRAARHAAKRSPGSEPATSSSIGPTMDLLVTTLLIVALFVLLGSGLWIGLSLLGVAWIGMELFTTRPVGDAMAVTIWGSLSSWTLTALPLFVWMGEILFRTRLSEDMFKGLAPWLSRIPGRLLHTNIIGCTIFAAVSGSSAATCATIGKMTLPELQKRGYPEDMTIGTLAGAGTLGLLIPPSIIMIVYGVSGRTSRSRASSSRA